MPGAHANGHCCLVQLGFKAVLPAAVPCWISSSAAASAIMDLAGGCALLSPSPCLGLPWFCRQPCTPGRGCSLDPSGLCVMAFAAHPCGDWRLSKLQHQVNTEAA